jgi:hypothetical protein
MSDERLQGLPAEIAIINLNPRESECIACGQFLVDPGQGLPMYEGRIVPVDYVGEWGGFDCCARCYAAYVAGGPAAVYARLEALGEARR